MPAVADAGSPDSSGQGSIQATKRVEIVPPTIRTEFNLAPFYTKYLDLGGLPIVGSTSVSEFALLEAGWIVSHMLSDRNDILHVLAASRVRLAVMAWNEFTTDIPEHSDLTPKVYWDRRARGLGATEARPAVSCAEENLLGYPGDPYDSENILIHEFAHAIHEMALKQIDSTFDARLRRTFQRAIEQGLWKDTYAGTNPSEYWAEGVQDWFDNNRENDAQHNQVNTRLELKEYDSLLAALCAEVFGEGSWRYQKPSDRAPKDRVHLAGFELSRAPRFTWRDAPIGPRPKVSIQTALGSIEIELDAEHAPLTTKNFLQYVQAGLYRNGRFHRTVTLSNQPTNTVKIEVIQASADPLRTNQFFPAILLERTRDTGLRHLDGTISMARDGPDSAQDEFFLCIEDQPELDFGGRRNRDGQGFAAFGQVVRGQDVLRKIQTAAAEGQILNPPILIQRIIRIE